MSLLNNGVLAGAVGKAVNGALAYGITLKVRDAGVDGFGNPSTTFTDAAVRGLRLNLDQKRAFQEGVPEANTNIIILQFNAAGAEPKRDDRIEANGETYVVLRVIEDPASATWECLCTDV